MFLLSKHLSRFLIVSSLLTLSFVFFQARASAEAGQAFSISPPLIELKADPAQTTSAKIKFTNISNGELLIKMQFNDFGAKNETGEPNIIFDDNQNTGYSLRQWITSPAPFKINSKETKTIEFPINVPKDAEPGGHYAVIRFTGTAPDLEESGVALSASIGSLVLLQVSGDIKEKSSVVEFYSATPQFNKRSFFEMGPITFVERIRNEGNVHIKPTGTIEITNMFGQKVATQRINGDPAESKNAPKSILPQSIRRFEQTLNTPWLLGKYEAKINVSYGQNQPPLVATTTFWVIPYKLILLILITLVGLFFILRYSIKRYNAHIINKAQGDGIHRPADDTPTFKIKKK